MGINLEYYRIFYYVANYKSITGAASKLCISQPAVSQAIKLLENSLNSRLFIRSAKGVQLTQEGTALYAYVKQGYEAILLGEDIVSRMQGLEAGEIRIGASDMTLQFYLLPYLESFHERYPNIKVTVTNGPTPETISYLKSGKIDFGVVSEPFVCESNMKVTQVRRIRDVFVGGSKYMSYKKGELTKEQLEALPIICLEQNTSTRTYVDGVLKKQDILLKPEFELATSDMIVQFALRNLGVGIVVEDFAKQYLDTGDLFEVRLQEPIPPRNLCLILDEQFPLSSAAQKLLSIVTETCN